MFDKGWIPSELNYKSMTNIFQLINTDYNTCVFNFTLSKNEVEILKKQVKSTSEKFPKLEGLTIPHNWENTVNKLNHFTFIIKDNHKSVFIAIDETKNKIYGWSK